MQHGIVSRKGPPTYRCLLSVRNAIHVMRAHVQRRGGVGLPALRIEFPSCASALPSEAHLGGYRPVTATPAPTKVYPARKRARHPILIIDHANLAYRYWLAPFRDSSVRLVSIVK